MKKLSELYFFTLINNYHMSTGQSTPVILRSFNLVVGKMVKPLSKFIFQIVISFRMNIQNMRDSAHDAQYYTCFALQMYNVYVCLLQLGSVCTMDKNITSGSPFPVWINVTHVPVDQMDR